jgi:hypothetical protein
MMKCLRQRLATHLWALCSQAAHDVTTLAQLKSVRNVDCFLTTKQGASQWKDSLALNVFTFENLVKLLKANSVNLVLFFIPIVLWTVAIQAVNITNGGRIHWAGMALMLSGDVIRSIMQANRGENSRKCSGKDSNDPCYSCEMMTS